jgi:Rrf2 family iron-sulfur cluster assembly transcriptional regulator
LSNLSQGIPLYRKKNKKLILSKACEYGVKAVLCISINSQKSTKVSLRTIAKNIESPEAFTSKVLQKLVRSHLVSSTKGATGGFSIDKDSMDKMLLWDVVKVMDGIEITEKCLLGMAHCSHVTPCPVHNQYSSIRLEILTLLRETKILDLSEKVKKGESILKI